MQPALLSPPLHDDVAYWLLRLSESLNRLNNGLLWAGSSPGELDRVLAPAQLRGSDLALDVIHAAACMRRFASEVFEPPLPSTRRRRGRGWKPPLKSTGWSVTVAMWSA